jgi:hypothetical protein
MVSGLEAQLCFLSWMVRAVVTEIYPVLAKARLCNCMARSAGTPWEIKDLSGLYRFWTRTGITVSQHSRHHLMQAVISS